MVIAKPNGAVELYYDNVKKLNTHSNGITVAGHINMNDNYKLLLGSSGSDLEIYHDGTNSIIDNNTNDLIIRCDSDDIKILAEDDIVLRDNDDSTNFIHCINGGAVDLYHNGTKKFETTSGGVLVTGDADSTTGIFERTTGFTSQLKFNSGNETQLIHASNGQVKLSFIGTGNAARGSIDAQSSFIRIKTNADETGVICRTDSSVDLYYDGSEKFETSSTGAIVRNAGSAVLQIIGNEGNAGALWLIADDGDDYTDTCRLHQSSDGRLYIQSNVASNTWENMITAGSNGSVELYYDNSKKAETTSGGFSVTGELRATTDLVMNSADNQKIYLGAGNDLQIYHNNGTSYIDATANGNTSAFSFKAAANIDIRVNGNEQAIYATSNGGVELYYDGAKQCETNSAGMKWNDDKKAFFGSSNDMQIYHQNGDSHITNAAGYLMINCTSGDAFLRADNDIAIQPQGGENGIKVAANGTVELFYDSARKFGTASHGIIIYGHPQPDADDDHDVGSAAKRWDNIHASNGTIQTSDANEKNTIVNTDLGLSFINKLTPKSYKFNGKTRTHYGLIAQDVETVLSDISKPTSGFAGYIKSDISEKQDGSAYRHGLRYNEFIAPLIKAIQELSAEVETLKTKVAALEAT